MSDELRAAKSAADDIEVSVEEAAPSQGAPPKDGVDSAPLSRRPKPRMSLRIPDDEVSRPRSAPPKVASAPPAANEPIAPARIITINPPTSDAAVTPRVVPSAPRMPSLPTAPAPQGASSALPSLPTAPTTPAAPPTNPAAPNARAAAAAGALPQPPAPHAPAVEQDLDPDKTQPRAAVGSIPEVPDTEMIPVTSSEPPPPSAPQLASSEAVDAEEMDEAESAAMLAAVRPPPDDESVDIPVDEEEEPAPSSDPEVIAQEPAPRAEVATTPAPLPVATAAAAAPAASPVRRSFPPAAAPIGMSSSPNLAATARGESGSPSGQHAALRGGATPAASPLAPPPMNEAAAARKRARPWWEELFNDDFLRTMAKITDPQIGGECDFIEESLGVAKGAMLLDLACGTGRHAIELTRRGYQVVGFDLSLPMLARAAEEAQERDQKINFVQGDMREMTFEETFDGVYCWNTSFGFFEEERNSQVVARVHKALRLGGQFLLDVANRDYVIKQSPSLCWFEGDGCICMDEMQVDFITSRMRVKRTMMMDDGRSKEIEYSIRLYSLHELGKILHDQGFRVVEVSGRMATPGVFFGNEAPRTLILAEKR